MSAKIRYTDESLGRPKVVRDFLPRPEDLVFRDEGVKVTIALSKRSVEFFKEEARPRTSRFNGPGLAVLAPAAERARKADMIPSSSVPSRQR